MMKIFYLLAITFLISCKANTKKLENEIAAEKQNKGEDIYKTHCASCHKPNEKYIGPALKGVRERWPSTTLLYEFIRNPQDVIGRNDYAKALYKEYKQSPMLPYPKLTDADIDGILNYCDQAN